MERGGGWMGGALDALTSALRMPAGSSAFGTWGLEAEAQPQGFGTWGGQGTGREADIFDPIALFEQQANEELARMIPGMATGTPGAPGGIGSTPASPGGTWAGVDRWDAQIAAASAATGVPANLIKAVMRLESGGDPGSVSVAGAQGLMQVMPFWNGTWGLNIYDPVQNVQMGAHILKQNYDTYGDWDTAIRAYLGFGQDAYGTTDQAYLQRVRQYWNELDTASPQPGGIGGAPTGGGYGGSQFNAIWGGGEYAITQEQGVSGFSQANCARFYEYATTLGLPACSHPGVDVGTPYGTALYTPVAGTVVRAGGSGYYCNSGNCTSPGVGEFRLKLANGDELILGHMSQIGVQVGQVLQAGAYVGRSGTEGSGAHVHVEYRQAGAATQSGFQAIDPRQVFGGGFTGGGFGAPGTGMPGMTQAPAFGGNWWNRPLDQILGG